MYSWNYTCQKKEYFFSKSSVVQIVSVEDRTKHKNRLCNSETSSLSKQ